MYRIVHSDNQRKGALAAVAFEGHAHGSEVSFFVGDLPPGKGPALHKHPYSETCIVRSGEAAMNVDCEDVTARAGDVVVIGADTPHRFVASGDERLDMVCIHASDEFVIEWLGE